MKRNCSDWCVWPSLAIVVSVFLCPVPAAAHLVTTGMGPVYDGIGHLLLTPEDLIPVIAIALYCGLRGPEAGRLLLFMLPLAWFAGGLLGLGADWLPAFPVQALSLILLGLLVAADLRMSYPIIILIIGLLGLMHGYFNGIALKSGPAVLGLFGIMSMIFVVVALVSSLVISLKIVWTRIVVRVFGSWIAASGMLMVGWFIKGQS